MKHLLWGALAAIALAGCSSIGTTPSDGSASERGRTPRTDAGAGKSDDGKWTVTCGLPTRENPLIDLLSSQEDLPPSVQRAGHILAKQLHQPHPEGGLSTELWILTPGLGEWWRVKAIRVHPDDVAKLTPERIESRDFGGIRQIIDSPFLDRPIIVRGEDEADAVTEYIGLMMPEASGLRCAR